MSHVPSNVRDGICTSYAKSGTTATNDLTTSLTSEELDSLPERIRTECWETGAAVRLYCAWGQKKA